jgi:hypothetical protein
MKNTKNRKNKNHIALVLALILIFTLGASGVYASNNPVVSHVDTGVVNIEISEYTLNGEGEEVPWVDNVGVLPGTPVSKIPYFTATGNDCYIRAKIEVDGVHEDATPLTDESFNGISDKWIKAGDYYYYKYPLLTNESVDFFHSFTIPTDWNDNVNPSNIGDWGFSVTVVVDAIQSDNFTPDFESNAPWGDVIVKESLHKDGYDVNEFTTNSITNMSIIIEDYDDIIINSDDFFEGFKTMVPGDSLADTVTIDSKYHCKLYFTTESLEDLDLLQHMMLKVILTKENKETVIYDGVLDSQITDMLLGEFKNGEKGELEFIVSMPAELDNEYTLRDGSVKWSFRAKPVERPGISEPPKTGDDNMLILYVGMMVFSGLSLIALLTTSLVRKRRESKDENNR